MDFFFENGPAPLALSLELIKKRSTLVWDCLPDVLFFPTIE